MLRAFIFFFFSTSLGFAADVSTAQQLQDAIIAANAGGDATINLTANITISGLANLAPFLNPLCSTTAFDPVDRNITINGDGFTLSGGSSIRGLFVLTGTVAVNDLLFTSMVNQGGSGGTGGGGGAGLGGALFVADGASVTLTNCTFSSCSARGGTGGSSGTSPAIASGGGGGMRGAGGTGSNSFGGGSGGGFGGNGGSGGTTNAPGGAGGGGAKTAGLSNSGTAGGAGGNDFAAVSTGGGGAGGTGGATGVPPGNGATPVASGKGGGGGGGQNSGTPGGPGGTGGNGTFGGGGGGGGGFNLSGTADAGNAGTGGFGAGGGGGGDAPSISGKGGNGGAGGFGGGGGSGGRGTVTSSGAGGNGGFGGGGGGNGPIFLGAARGTVGSGGFPTDPITAMQTGFGGNGGNSGTAGVFIHGPGGGGAGLGGAIFIQEGGELTIQDSVTFTSNSVTAGAAGVPGSGGTAGTAGTALGVDIFMMSGSTLIFDLSFSTTLSNVIAGNQGIISPGIPDSSTANGGLTKRGSSTLILSGNQTYTGTTHIEEGTLLLIGSTLTDVQIDVGATFTGGFSVASDRLSHGGNVTNAGILAPGVSGVGSIEIEGTYTNTATGKLIVDITPDGTVHDTIVGASSIVLQNGSAIEVVCNAGNYIAGTSYTIATAPVTGTFTTVTKSGAAADKVTITVSYGSLIITITDTTFAGGEFLFPGTPTIVNNTIEAGTLIPGSDFATIVEILGTLGTEELNEVLVSMSPVRFGAIEWINTWNNSYVASLIRKHIFDFCQARKCALVPSFGKLWASSFGGWVGEKPVGDVGPFDAQNVGVLVGSDFYCRKDVSFGAAWGYTRSFLQWEDHAGKGFLNSYYGSLYGSWQGEWTNVDFSLIGGATNQDLTRNLIFSSINRKAKSDFWGQFFTVHGGVEGICGPKTLECRPYATVDYNYWHQNAFQEEGADSLNLNVFSKTQNFMRGEAGARLFWEMKGDESCFSPYLGLSWVGDFPLEDSKFQATFIDQQPVMDVTSYTKSQQMVSPQAGLQYTHCYGVRGIVSYKGFYNRDIEINDFEARIDWRF